MRRSAFALFVLLLSACTTNPPRETPVPQPARAPAFDPVGTYDFSLEMMGQTQTGEMRIGRQEGQLTGSLGAQGQSVELRNMKLEDRKVTATAVAPQGGPEVQLVINFEDNDKFAGTLAVPGMGEARIWGTRRKT